jgi:uncharacterized protein
MLISLALTAGMMGLAAGWHCVGMCGGWMCLVASPDEPGAWLKALAFHAGRMAGYGLLGAAAGGLAEVTRMFAFEWQGLRSLWMFLQATTLVAGLFLLLLGRLPVWATRAVPVARPIHWSKGRWARRAGLGLGWALIPCGLLHAAVLLAVLAASWVGGAVTMAAFTVGTALWLLPFTLMARRAFQGMAPQGRRAHALAIRLSGLVIATQAAVSIWLAASHGILGLCH